MGYDQLNVTWKDSGHSNLPQSVYWQSGFFNLPWVGMDSEICKYVNDGNGCPFSPEEQGKSNFIYPIKILEVYPAGYYKLIWSLIDRVGEEQLYLSYQDIGGISSRLLQAHMVSDRSSWRRATLFILSRYWRYIQQAITSSYGL